MIVVDPRIGSGEMEPYLSTLGPPGEVVVSPTNVPFGDFNWIGFGPGGLPLPIGVERKTLADFIGSVRTGRMFSTQIPGLLGSYVEVWIIIEGIWRGDKDGTLLVPKGNEWVPFDKGGPLTIETLEKMMLTTELKSVETAQGSGGRIHFRRTMSKAETCRLIRAQYEWWTQGTWEAHRSHLKFPSDHGAIPLQKLDPTNPHHLVRLMAKELQGIGWDKSTAIADQFPTMRDLVDATIKEWQSIPGIGKTLATRIRRALWGIDEDTK